MSSFRLRRAGGSSTLPTEAGAAAIEWRDWSEPLAAEWDELADRAAGIPWVRPGWVAAWWQAFGRGHLELLVARRDGRLAGLVPLERRRGRVASPTNPHTPGFCLLAEDDAAQHALAGALMRHRVRQVTLGYLPAAGAGLAESRQAARAAGRLLAAWPMLRSPYIPVEGESASSLRDIGAHKRSELRRRRRRLERLGTLAVEVHDGREQLGELLAEGWQVEASGWKGQRGTAIASHTDTREFYQAVARWAADRGWLRLAFLRLDGQPLAFDFSIEESGVHYLLKTGYDPAWRAYGPGVLLRHEMIARAFTLRLDRYELLGADEPWKADWTDRVHELFALQAFTRSPTGLASWAAWAHGRPVAKRVMTSLGRR